MTQILVVAAGAYGNLASLGSGVTASSSNPQYPAAAVINGNPGSPWIALNSISPQYLQVDMNHRDNTNGGFESWSGGNPVGWSKTQNPATPILLNQETNPAFVHGGASSARFDKFSSPQYVLAYKDFVVPSGSVYRLKMWVRDAAAAAGVFIQNLDTGQYIKPAVSVGGSADSIAEIWDPAPALFHGFSASGLSPGSWVQEITSPFHVEDWWEAPGNASGRLPTYKDTTTIRVFIGWPANTAAVGTFYLDDFLMLPMLNAASLHYHNLRTRDLVRLRASDDGTNFTDVTSGAFTFGGVANRKQDAYVTFSNLYRQYVRLAIDAPASFNVGGAFEQGAPMVGQLMLSQGRLLAADLGEEYPADTNHVWMQQRDERGTYAYAMEDQPVRSRDLKLEPHGDIESAQAIADVLINLYYRSGGGRFPVVVAPQNDARDVFYGRFPPDLKLSRSHFIVYGGGLPIMGFAPPVPL